MSVDIGGEKSAFYYSPSGQLCKKHTFYNNCKHYHVKPGDRLEVTDRCTHEDWKTVAAFPDRYPYLEPGTIGEVVEIFQNCYGKYVRLKVGQRVYDISPGNLFYPQS